MRRFDTNIITKVIIALLLAIITLYISKQVTERSLRNTLLPIKQLSEVNPQTQLANDLFKDIVALDYEQRIYINQNSNNKLSAYINSGKEVLQKLDSLEFLSKESPMQVARVQKMKAIMTERNHLFFQYINLRSQFNKNKALDNQIQELSDFVNYFSIRGDSSIYSTQTSIKHSTVEQEIEDTTPVKRNIIQKILGTNKKAPPQKEINHFVLEQSETTVDTVALREDDSIITQFTNTLSQIEKNRKKQLQNINVKQQAFEVSNNTLIQELLKILNEVESETILKNNENNALAASIIDDGLNTTNQVLLAFIVLAVVFSFLIFSDIAKSNRYRKELIIAKEQAEILSKSRQQFLSNMSHELRTPLQSIIGYTELMQNNDSNIDPQNINAVYQSSQHLLDIVNQILDYNSIQANGIQLEKKTFHIQSILQEVFNTIIIQCQQKQLALESNIASIQNNALIGDSFRLKQILINLLNNAVKFTERGAITLEIVQQIGKHSSQYTFIIKDTGIGIDSNKLNLIFEEFEQINNNHVHNGNGLGLNIVKRILHEMNGNIEVKSNKGMGSTFTVQLQFPNAEQQSTSSLPSISITNDLHSHSIWLIDDDSLILKLYEQILVKYNWKFQTFDHPKDVLAQPIPDALSIILMDIRMPEISGFDLIKILKSKQQFAHIPIIAVTAQVLAEEKEAILAQGFDGILHKPFLENDLLQIIQQFTSSTIAQSNTIETERDDIINLFIIETQKDKIQFQNAVTKNDNEHKAAIAHKLAGRLGQMQYNKEARAFRKVEILIKQQQNDTIASNEAIEVLDTLLGTLT